MIHAPRPLTAAIRLFILAALLSGISPLTPAAQSEPSASPLPPNPTLGDSFIEDLPSSPPLKMVWIPAGSFTMGNTRTPAELIEIFGGKEKDYLKEYPAHEVELDGFWMGAYMITNEQYKLFDPDHSNNRDASQELPAVPVMQVSWAQAMEYCDWLTSRTGRRYTLPTEAQYEYATRAGTTTLFPWGDDLNGAEGYANVPDIQCRREYPVVTESSDKAGLTLFDFDDGYTFAAPVGQFKPNAWGLYDMIGNTYSWCADYWADDYYARSPHRNPTGPETGTARSARTGAWMIHPIGCRSASRNYAPPGVSRPFLGFRVVISEPY